MANEVYLVTHDSLSNIVSARAASRVLDRALKTKGFSPETISPQQMQAILTGPVLKELQSILPSEGVKRTIQQITRALEIKTKTPLASTPLSVEADIESESVGNLVEEQSSIKAHLSSVRPPAVLKTNFSEEELEAFSLECAQLKHVTLVATIEVSSGKVLNSRGGGFDLEGLSRIANLSLKLLQRSGEIRSYHLEESKYHMFLLPLGDFVLTVIGSREINVGAVFAKFSGVKEGV